MKTYPTKKIDLWRKGSRKEKMEVTVVLFQLSNGKKGTTCFIIELS